MSNNVKPQPIITFTDECQRETIKAMARALACCVEALGLLYPGVTADGHFAWDDQAELALAFYSVEDAILKLIGGLRCDECRANGQPADESERHCVWELVRQHDPRFDPETTVPWW